MYAETTAGAANPSVRQRLDAQINTVQRCLNTARNVRASIAGHRPEAIGRPDEIRKEESLSDYTNKLNALLNELEDVLSQIENQI